MSGLVTPRPGLCSPWGAYEHGGWRGAAASAPGTLRDHPALGDDVLAGEVERREEVTPAAKLLLGDFGRDVALRRSDMEADVALGRQRKVGRGGHPGRGLRSHAQEALAGLASREVLARTNRPAAGTRIEADRPVGHGDDRDGR